MKRSIVLVAIGLITIVGWRSLRNPSTIQDQQPRPPVSTWVEKSPAAESGGTRTLIAAAERRQDALAPLLDDARRRGDAAEVERLTQMVEHARSLRQQLAAH